MTYSPLVSLIHLSPMNSGKRNHKIDTISIHCVAGDLSVEALGNLFQTREASSNYGVDSSGRIGLYVDEENRSWCTSSASNDNRAITIEVANIEAKEPYRISDKAYKSLIELLVDICKRNNIPKLMWKADPSLIGQVDKQNMTVHRWFANKSCPGTWLFQHHGQIADDVNTVLRAEEDDDMDINRFAELMKEYRKDLQDNDASAWSAEAREWAINVGLVKGNGSGNYMWEDLLTREQMAVMLYRFAQSIGK